MDCGVQNTLRKSKRDSYEPGLCLSRLSSAPTMTRFKRAVPYADDAMNLPVHDVEEAIHLADRIVVLSPRPTRIQTIFPVPFGHPRKVAGREAQELRIRILSELGVDREEIG